MTPAHRQRLTDWMGGLVENAEMREDADGKWHVTKRVNLTVTDFKMFVRLLLETDP